MIDLADPGRATDAMRVLTSIAAGLSAAEWLVLRREFGRGGFADPHVLRLRRPRRRRSPPRGPGLRARVPGALALLQLALSPLVAVGPGGGARLWLIAGLTACHLLLLATIDLGLDGSDRLLTVLLVGLACAEAAPSDAVRQAALWFVAGHALLAYTAAGWAKALSPQWRSGNAITGILGTRAFGQPALARLVAANPQATRLVARFTIALECALPALALAGAVGAVAFVASGLAFHASTAVAMGLNRFPWVFAATYPAVFHVGTSITG